MDLHERRRNRRRDHLGNRNSGHELRYRLSAILRAIPEVQVCDDAWEKSSFRNTQQKPHRIKFQLRMDKSRSCCNASPSEHCRGHRLSSAPFFHEQRAGNTKNDVSDKKDPRAQAEYGVREVQLIGPLQTRKTDVVAIDIRNDIEQKQK